MKGQTVHKYPMHQLLMVYHGDNGLEALSLSSQLLTKIHVFLQWKNLNLHLNFPFLPAELLLLLCCKQKFSLKGPD